MKRYLNSFFITLVLYSGVIFVLFTLFNNEKILLKKEKPLSQTISLQHIELLPIPKVEKKIEKKVEKKVEKIIEKPKEIIKKELVKKEEVQKIEPKKKITKKTEKKKIKKIVKKKIVKKPKKVVKKKLIKKKVLKTKDVVKKQVLKTKDVVKKQVQKEKIINTQKPKKVVKRDIKKEYLSKHLSLIRAYIKKNVHYPKSAKRLRIQGIVNVKFTLRSNGKVDNIVILNGHSRLKKSTINAVKDASSSFPKIKKDITIQLPIEYKLI